MDKCLACGSTDIVRARNDCGHFKADGMRPARMYQYYCRTCGFVATFVPKEASSS